MDFKGATRLFADPDFDGEPVVIIHVLEPTGWTPVSLVEIEAIDNKIANIDDYFLTPWVLSAALSTDAGEVS